MFKVIEQNDSDALLEMRCFTPRNIFNSLSKAQRQIIYSNVVSGIEGICTQNKLPMEKVRPTAFVLLGALAQSLPPQKKSKKSSGQVRQQVSLKKEVKLTQQEICLNVMYGLERICTDNQLSLKRIRLASFFLLGTRAASIDTRKLPSKAVKLWSDRSRDEKDMDPHDFYRKYWGPFRNLITLSYLEKKDRELVVAIYKRYKKEGAEKYLPPRISEREQKERAEQIKQAQKEKEEDAKNAAAREWEKDKRNDPELKRIADQLGL